MPTSLLELFERGGPVMWPILFCSIFALAIGLERLLLLLRVEEESSRLLREVCEAIEQRQMAQAENLSAGSEGPLPRMVQAGIRRYGRPRQEILEILEEAAALEMPSLEKHIPMLGTIAHLAPLLGLLGTVTGLVRCFQVIQEKTSTVNPVNPADLAGGIWEALLTTVFGLLVAIPAYALYNYLAVRVNNFTHHLELSAVRLADLLSGEHRRGP